jgi:chromosome segregation ATPase
MQQKYNNEICAESTTSAVGTTKVASASINDMETCVNSLVEKAGVKQDIARNACSQKYSAENQGYQERLLALEKKIQEQQAIITNLKSRISDIQEKINSATPEEKAKYIQDNASDIKSDTIAKIDKKIESLKKLIENIDSSEMDETKKAEMIDSINNNIASLEMQKANIENAETTEELKVYLTEARNADNLANKEAIISSLEKQTLELETIIDKYFRANSDYQNLVTEIDSLKEKISAISSESTSEEINSIKDEYKALRDKIKSIAQESVVQ